MNAQENTNHQQLYYDWNTSPGCTNTPVYDDRQIGEPEQLATRNVPNYTTKEQRECVYGTRLAATYEDTHHNQLNEVGPVYSHGQLVNSTQHASNVFVSYPLHHVPLRTEEISVELLQADLWQQFNSVGTEMILTKTGRRMFPGCRIRLSGLDPSAQYCVMMDVQRVDPHRYRFQHGEWTPAGQGEVDFPQRYFVHQDSPASGAKLMKKILSFHKAKLSNSNSNSNYENGKFILHSMHRYQLRIHVVKSTDAATAHLQTPNTFPLPLTTFVTVTAYQNTELTVLKIQNNPFAKGFREDGARGKKSKKSSLEEAFSEDSSFAKRMKLTLQNTQECQDNFVYPVGYSSSQSPYTMIRERAPVSGFAHHPDDIAQQDSVSLYSPSVSKATLSPYTRDPQYYNIANTLQSDHCAYSTGHHATTAFPSVDNVNAPYYSYHSGNLDSHISYTHYNESGSFPNQYTAPITNQLTYTPQESINSEIEINPGMLHEKQGHYIQLPSDEGYSSPTNTNLHTVL